MKKLTCLWRRARGATGRQERWDRGGTASPDDFWRGRDGGGGATGERRGRERGTTDMWRRERERAVRSGDTEKKEEGRNEPSRLKRLIFGGQVEAVENKSLFSVDVSDTAENKPIFGGCDRGR